MHRLLADEVALLPGQLQQAGDLLGDALLLVERERDGLGGVREVGLRSRHGRNRHGPVGVEQELDEHHRVVPLLHGLAVEVSGEVGKRFGVEPDRDRDVLLRGRGLIADLLVDRIVETAHRNHSTAAWRTLQT